MQSRQLQGVRRIALGFIGLNTDHPSAIRRTPCSCLDCIRNVVADWSSFGSYKNRLNSQNKSHADADRSPLVETELRTGPQVWVSWQRTDAYVGFLFRTGVSKLMRRQSLSRVLKEMNIDWQRKL